MLGRPSQPSFSLTSSFSSPSHPPAPASSRTSAWHPALAAASQPRGVPCGHCSHPPHAQAYFLLTLFLSLTASPNGIQSSTFYFSSLGPITILKHTFTKTQTPLPFASLEILHLRTSPAVLLLSSMYKLLLVPPDKTTSQMAVRGFKHLRFMV